MCLCISTISFCAFLSLCLPVFLYFCLSTPFCVFTFLPHLSVSLCLSVPFWPFCVSIFRPYLSVSLCPSMYASGCFSLSSVYLFTVSKPESKKTLAHYNRKTISKQIFRIYVFLSLNGTCKVQVYLNFFHCWPLSFSLSVCLSVSLSVGLSVSLFFCSVCLTLSVCVSVSLCLLVCLSLNSSVSLSLCPVISL
jgi:hypothetical protein